MTKEEIYTGAVNVMKETGQGISKLMVSLSPKWNEIEPLFQELIDEGKLYVSNHTDDEWYQIPNVYDFTKDEDLGFFNLDAVRIYLGSQGMDDRLNMGGLLPEGQQTMTALLDTNPDLRVEYDAWLEKNREGLDAIKALEV